jgi:hypothetical protein
MDDDYQTVLEKAEQCRQLARVLEENDPTRATLRSMALEFEAKAAAFRQSHGGRSTMGPSRPRL